MNPRALVDFSMRDKDLPHVRAELSIFSFALADRALSPCIKSTLRNLKHVTHDDNGKLLLVLFDKLLFHLDSREKMLTTFLVYRAPAVLSPARGGIAAIFFL